MSGGLIVASVAAVWRASTGSERDDRVSEALLGEPVVVTGAADQGRLPVVLPWQPSSLDRRGYPGWVDAVDVDVSPPDVVTPPLHVPSSALAPGPSDAVALGRSLVGTPYLWGGLSRDGIDCSGLVHLVHRALGVVVPRDARDQAAALPVVPLEDVVAGDLYVFARPGRAVHHVGLVTEPGVVLHASDRDGGVVEAALGSTGRMPDLVGARRVTIVLR